MTVEVIRPRRSFQVDRLSVSRVLSRSRSQVADSLEGAGGGDEVELEGRGWGFEGTSTASKFLAKQHDLTIERFDPSDLGFEQHRGIGLELAEDFEHLEVHALPTDGATSNDGPDITCKRTSANLARTDSVDVWEARKDESTRMVKRAWPIVRMSPSRSAEAPSTGWSLINVRRPRRSIT